MTDLYEEIVAREIVTTRVYDALRIEVFTAWTTEQRLKVWWGPRGFTNTFAEFGIKPGAAWKYTMHGPDGKDYPNEAKVIDVVDGDRIVIDHVSMPRFRLTALFEDVGDGTKLTFRQLFETNAVYSAVRQFAVPGNEDNLDRLGELLAGAAVR